MTVNNAVAKRIFELLEQRGITQYRLEQITGIQHGSMQCIMNGRNKNVKLSTLLIIAKGFDMTVSQFLHSELFDLENIDIEQ